MVVEIAELDADRSFDNTVVLPLSWLANIENNGLWLDQLVVKLRNKD